MESGKAQPPSAGAQPPSAGAQPPSAGAQPPSAGAQPPSAEPAGPSYPDTHYVQGSALQQNNDAGTEVVEVDSHTDSESSYESGDSSETTSVSSSVFSFTYANGRRYQSDRFQHADYFLPNDEVEQDRLDLYHHIFLLLLGGKLYTAPLENPQMVLDVGTGTGIWAIDFADMHPEAQVIGTDINAIQPSWVPPNTTFMIDDVEDEWTFKDNHFDFIHMRSLSGSFKDWNAVLTQAYRTLAPGGYLEFQDYGCEVFLSNGTRLDGEIPEHPIARYMSVINAAAARTGRPFAIARGMAERMKEVGFVDIQQRTTTWPLGPWPKQRDLKELGKWGKMAYVEGALPFALMLLTREGWSKETITEMIDAATASLKKNSYYVQAWFVYGRKPEA